ncbi:PqqD family protein [Anabaena sp. UHCC 0451]|uniref:PqqD family protein n=1 Tax=Anabaena sp. UHCC 0451 TaxID=2055235 RepID=UPI002B202E4A|nr:PqqD family protein [Anabaena sp. UHCC 0451]MEA5578489.1 PqqD family protein [Anabaena sp. UHCC 0451]
MIVSLDKGTYYSLDRVGADIWNLIEQESSVGKIVAAIAQQFTGDSELIESSIKTLIAQLQAEELISPVGANLGEDNFTGVSIESKVIKEEFVPPVLQKYSDMQELLMLDPIHEVDEAEGWPQKKEESVI